MLTLEAGEKTLAMWQHNLPQVEIVFKKTVAPCDSMFLKSYLFATSALLSVFFGYLINKTPSSQPTTSNLAQ